MLKISTALTAAELRGWARRCGNSRAASRAYAIANALDGMSRAEAARLAGMDRQTLRDAVQRYNMEGAAGLFDRPKGHPPRCLTETEQSALAAAVRRGPDPFEDGVVVWTRESLARWVARHFGKSVHPASLSRILRRMGMNWGHPAMRLRARPVVVRSLGA